MRRWRHVSSRHRPAARSPNVQAPCPLPGRHGAGAKPAGLLPARGFRCPGQGVVAPQPAPAAVHHRFRTPRTVCVWPCSGLRGFHDVRRARAAYSTRASTPARQGRHRAAAQPRAGGVPDRFQAFRSHTGSYGGRRPVRPPLVELFWISYLTPWPAGLWSGPAPTYSAAPPSRSSAGLPFWGDHDRNPCGDPAGELLPGTAPRSATGTRAEAGGAGNAASKEGVRGATTIVSW
jgi:hypothetical protein